jgi:hypothetical protein
MVILFLVALTFLSILFLYSSKFNRNITSFMVIGDYFKAPHIWTEKTLVLQDSVGYDGQFYYYIAHDPFILGQFYGHIDSPAYRYQRLIYPLTVRLMSFGQSALIPWMMVIVNLFTVLLGTWLVTLILRNFGLSPWYSLFYASLWGFLLSLLRSLPEPLAITFVVGAVFFYFKGKIISQAIALSLAALTQETTLLVSLAFFLYWLGKKNFRNLLFMLLPPLVYLLWQLYIFSHFHMFSYIGGTHNFGLPFLGITEKFLSLSKTGNALEKTAEFFYLLTVYFLIFIACYQVVRYYSPLTLSFMSYALMTSLFTNLIWVEPWSYARATLGLSVFNFLVFTKEGTKLNLVPMLFIPVVFLFSLLSMKLL